MPIYVGKVNSCPAYVVACQDSNGTMGLRFGLGKLVANRLWSSDLIALENEGGEVKVFQNATIEKSQPWRYLDSVCISFDSPDSELIKYINNFSCRLLTLVNSSLGDQRIIGAHVAADLYALYVNVELAGYLAAHCRYFTLWRFASGWGEFVVIFPNISRVKVDELLEDVDELIQFDDVSSIPVW